MKVNLAMLVAQIAGMFAVFALILFFTAGTIFWIGGWAFWLLFLVFTISLSAWLLKTNPALLTERMTGIGKADQKSWDKVLFGVMYVLFAAWLLIIPLDAVRFHWSVMPVWLQVLGALFLLISFYLYFLTFRENTFLSPAVRIQRERGQEVVSTGPYHYVRHPMYATTILFMLGATLLMGSWYGILLEAVLFLAIGYRAVQEEHTLQQELAGYDAYKTQVHYRFVPYIW